jgi:hypothetical protein
MKKALVFCSLVTLLFVALPQVHAQVYTTRDLSRDVDTACDLTRQIHNRAVLLSEAMTETFAPAKKPVIRHRAEDLGAFNASVRPHIVVKTETERLKEVNQRIFFILSRNSNDAENLRLDFAHLLATPGYREYRYGLLGVVELLGVLTDISHTASMKKLTALTPALYEESAAAVRSLPAGFLRLPVDNQNAYDSLISHADKEEKKDKPPAQVLPDHIMQDLIDAARPVAGPHIPSGPRPLPQGNSRSSSGSGSGSRMSWDSMKELGSNIVNNVLDNLYEDFQQGSQWGSQAGSIISAVSGMQGAVSTVAAGASVMDLVETSVDSMMPDPYEIVGEYAGGVIGMIGGAVGTTAGWIVGTIESNMSSGGGRSRAGGGGGTILLF